MTPLRWSNLKWIGRSPAHARYYLDNPIAETDAIRLGQAVHGLVLRGECFATYGSARRGKEWEAFQAEHANETILTTTAAERALAIAEAVTDSDQAMDVLRGTVEQRIKWQIAGRDCAGTPDVVSHASVADLKITHDAGPNRFPWHARRMGWHGQLVWYGDGLRAANLALPEEYYIVAVEATPPHPVAVYMLTPAAIEAGRRLWRSYFETWRICEEANEWPGYAAGLIPLDFPDMDELTLTLEGEEIEL